MNCRDFTSEIACLSRADGTQENIIVINTYALNEDKEEIVKAVRYTTSDSTPITLQPDDVVTVGECSIAKEIVIPTISVVDFDSNGEQNSDGPVQALAAANYTTDIEALPVGVPEGTVLPVQLNGITEEYYSGNGTTNQAHVGSKVVFPRSAVIRTEDNVVEKPITLEANTFTNNQTVAAGAMEVTIQVLSGTVTVNGMSVSSCSPAVFQNQSHGSCKYVYDSFNIVAGAGAEYNLIVQR